MRFTLSILLLLLASTATRAADEAALTILPADFTLTGPAARRRLLVQGTQGGKLFTQLGKDVTLKSSDEKVVKIDDASGAAIPVANGSAVITATANNRIATTKVTVAAMDKPFDWS